MSVGFCTRCGAASAAGASFCTICGAAASGSAPSSNPASSHGIATAPALTTAIAMGSLLLALGGVATFFALRTPALAPRAVAGTPDARPGGASPGGAPQAEGLPTGHPSIELPKEVVDFLDGLSAEAEKNPQSVEAAQKLARARYRASVINASYRASAEQSLGKLLALDPDNSEGLRISANLAYDAGDYPSAQKRFETFLAQNPDDASAITDLGSALLFQERLDDAVEAYQDAIAKDATFMQAHFNLGIAFEKQGRKDEAIASLKRAASLADTPQEKQHIENALAELEGRQPATIAGAGPAVPAGAAASGGPAGGAAAAGSGASAAAAAAAAGPAGGARAAGSMAVAPATSGDTPASASGGAPATAIPGGAPASAMPGAMPPPVPDRDVPTNASSSFQRLAEKPFVTHGIVGPRIVAFEWSSPTALRAKIADFPMDQMPPFARVKFKTGMSEKLAAIARQESVAGPVTVEIVDDASGRVMETLDAAAATAPAAQ